MENLLTAKQYFSLTDYDSRDMWELIKGVLKMSPAPMTVHQKISGNLHLFLGTKFKRHEKFHVRYSPYDLNINETSVVQPDICVIDNIQNETKRYFEGVPVVIVEILSPSSVEYDSKRKYELYEECGVPEYWIVSPFDEKIQVFRLEKGKYIKIGEFGQDSTFVSTALDGLNVIVNEVFY